MITRRSCLIALGAAGGLAAAGPAAAQDNWPARPVRIIVPFPAGGSSDPPMRALAQRLQQALGQTVVVENVGGGGGTLATARMAQAAPDGYTLGMAAVGTLCIAPHLYNNPGYDPLKSFTPISLLGDYANMLVVPADSPYKSLGDLIQAAKASPGTINFGSSGIGSSNHLSAELLSSLTGTKFTHVPFRGTGPALNELLAGRLGFMFDVTNNSLPWVREGKLRALGVTGPASVAQLPDVPPVARVVPGYEVLGWIGLIGPAGLPPRVVERLGTELDRIMHNPEFMKQFSGFGFEPRYTRPAPFAALIRKDYEFWGPVVKASGAKVE